MQSSYYNMMGGIRQFVTIANSASHVFVHCEHESRPKYELAKSNQVYFETLGTNPEFTVFVLKLYRSDLIEQTILLYLFLSLWAE